MGDRYEALTEKHIFFVGTAAADGCASLSPKGMGSFRVIEDTKVVWLNLTLIDLCCK